MFSGSGARAGAMNPPGSLRGGIPWKNPVSANFLFYSGLRYVFQNSLKTRLNYIKITLKVDLPPPLKKSCLRPWSGAKVYNWTAACQKHHSLQVGFPVVEDRTVSLACLMSELFAPMNPNTRNSPLLFMGGGGESTKYYFLTFWLKFFLRPVIWLLCIFFGSQHFSNLRSVNYFCEKTFLDFFFLLQFFFFL